MNTDEKQRLVAVLITADGGCSNCVADIAGEMERAFPGEGWEKRVIEAYYEGRPEPTHRIVGPPATATDFTEVLKKAWIVEEELDEH